MKHRLIRTAILCFCALLVGGLIALWQMAPATTAKTPVNSVAGAPVGGPFTLTDQNGAVFTDRDMAGHYVLLYFGFTFCPAICPTELQKISAALKIADEKKAEKILPVFITIDPERDTVETMKNYVPQFNPRLVGLTGTPERVSATLKSYHVYAAKVQDEGMSDYTMDHSSYIYFIAPDGTLIALFGTDSTAAQIAEAIAANIP